MATLGLTDKELDIITQRERERKDEFVRVAEELSLARRAAALRLTVRLQILLRKLGIPNATFETQFSSEELPQDKWSESGLDEGEFLFSANPGETVRPFARIASGGELSRVMLALKTLAPVDNVGKTLVFDEVDAGVGGRVASGTIDSRNSTERIRFLYPTTIFMGGNNSAAVSDFQILTT